MNVETLLRAAQILRSQPAYAMPLAKLHARLCDELGPDVATYGQLHRLLKNRPQSFAVIDTPRLLDTAAQWPLHVREEYDRALEPEGLGSYLRVALTEVPADADLTNALDLAAATLSELWSAAESDAILRELLGRATDQLDEISRPVSASAAKHPTIRPPDPRKRQ